MKLLDHFVDALLDRPYLDWVLSFTISFFVVSYAYPWAQSLYAYQAPNLPGTAFSLFGFVIAALSILVALKGQGQLKTLETSGGLWSRLISNFINSAKALAVLAGFTMLFEPTIVKALPPLVSKATICVFTFLLVYSAFLLIKVIHLLKSIAIISTLPTKS